MITRPRLLDLFCGAGGAAMGYRLAGFEVTGVDIRLQPRYPFPFIQADALAYVREHGREYDVIHASPPCQTYSKEAGQHGTRTLHPDLIKPTRAVLQATGKPYVIENIMEAHRHLVSPVRLCGTMFDLGVFRHRLFESSEMISLPVHVAHTGRIGDGKYVTVTGGTGGSSLRDKIQHGRKIDWQYAMGIDWMTVKEMGQAIPPTYTQYVGHYLMAALKSRRVA